MKWPFFIVSGALIGCVLHIVSLLAVPALAMHDAYSRLRAIGDQNTLIVLDESDPAKSLPFLDPAFVYAVCTFDVSEGPVSVRVPLASQYVSMAFHDRDGTAFFSLNDRSALGTVLDAEMREVDDEESKALPLGAGTIAVATPGPVGFVVVRAFAPFPSAVPSIKQALSKAVCSPRT